MHNSREGARAVMSVLCAVLVILAVLLPCGCARRASTALERGLALYDENNMEDALPLLEGAVGEGPDDADALAWLAETYRRLGEFEKSVATARKAAAIERCHAFALTIIGDAFNPQFSAWEETDADSTWKYLRKAVACDRNEGGAWLGIWCESIRRGEFNTMKQSLRALVDTGFLTPTVLAYNRWMLHNLPENAVLVTNGDMDTYPAAALQEVERFRDDVAIVNRSLLNTAWYARFIRDHYGVPLPYGDTELALLRPVRNDDGGLVFVATQIIEGWERMRTAGDLPREIAFAVTVPPDAMPHTEDRLVTAGGFRVWSPQPVEGRIDTARVRKSLAEVVAADYAGPWVSPRDRSPVRRTHGGAWGTISLFWPSTTRARSSNRGAPERGTIRSYGRRDSRMKRCRSMNWKMRSTRSRRGRLALFNRHSCNSHPG